MFRCGKTLSALAILTAISVAVSAQTADNPRAPGKRAQRRANLRQVQNC